MVDMPRKRPPNLTRERTRHGKMVWFYRIGKGSRIRLPDIYGTAEFWEAYEAAHAGKPIGISKVSTRSGTWAWMVMMYLDSRAFDTLAETTQKQRRKLLRDAAHKAGKLPPESVTEASIRKVMIERPPHAANNFLKALRGFYKWAIETGQIDRDKNPVDKINSNITKGGGWANWSTEMIDAYRATWPVDTMERTAFELLLATGLRLSDVVRVGVFHHRGELLEIKAEKNKVLCYIPVTPAIDRIVATTPKGQVTYLVDQFGKAFSKPMFGKWFNASCVKAGIPEKIRSHGIRKTAATMDAESGKSAHWLMAKYGWTKIEEAERYTRKADRRRIVLEKSDDTPYPIKFGGSKK